MAAGELEEAKSLAYDGMNLGDASQGGQSDWAPLLLAIAQAEDDREAIIRWSAYGVLNQYGAFDELWPLLKAQYTAVQWPAEVDNLLAQLPSNYWNNHTHYYILAAEERTADLIAVLQTNEASPSTFEPFLPTLLPQYQAEVTQLYRRFVFEQLAERADRRKYRNCCKILVQMQKKGLYDEACEIAAEMAQQYRNRPSLLRELHTFGFLTK